MKELNILSRTEVSWNLYEPRRTIRMASEILKMNPTLFSAPGSETGQQSAPHIQLQLMPRQPQQAFTRYDFLAHDKLTTDVQTHVRRFQIFHSTTVNYGVHAM